VSAFAMGGEALSGGGEALSTSARELVRIDSYRYRLSGIFAKPGWGYVWI
jgi:hypothetical protein